MPLPADMPWGVTLPPPDGGFVKSGMGRTPHGVGSVSRPKLRDMKTPATIQQSMKNPFRNAREWLIVILLALLCAVSFTMNAAGGLIHVSLVAAVVMSVIHLARIHRNGAPLIQPALGFYRLKAAATHERNATPSHCVRAKNRIRIC